MVGSIDPRCETVRGIHWPKKGREVVWSSRRGNHLGQRPKATASTGRTYGCKRSDQTLKKLLWHGGRPHMGPGSRSLRSLVRDDEDGCIVDSIFKIAVMASVSEAIQRPRHSGMVRWHQTR